MAVNGVAVADTVFGETLEYCRDRKAFGQPIGSFQYNRFALAEMNTEIDIVQTYIDRCIVELGEGSLTAIDAAKAKWWATEMQKRIVDRCLQLHGGYGYMTEYPVAKAYVDARAQTIYGGTTEIMKEIIGRDLGL
jgi:alkylation response protein AidB-like acyl-CoA dehydrogenase